MPERNFSNRTLYHGDNLEFLRGMNSGTVNLIATDPPFNKSRDFHATPDSLAAGASFQDRWSWRDDVHDDWITALMRDEPEVYHVITTAKEVYGDDMGAFLCWLGVRLLEMHRVLAEDGSLYLHIDHTAHAWVKCLLDAIFGKGNFRNAISWQRNDGRGKGSQHQSKRWGNNTDVLLFYAKSDRGGVRPYRPLTPEEVATKFPKTDSKGRRYYTGIPIFRSRSMGARPNLCYEWRGFTNPHPSGWRLSKDTLEEEYSKGNVVIRDDGQIERRKYMEDYIGEPVDDFWHDVPRLASGAESTGYPTQKPLALYERIIQASSNPGDVVLDPFAGCATTPVAAERLGRQWVGMDIWDGAIDQVRQRMADNRQLLVDIPPEIIYSTEPPRRTDTGEVAALALATPTNRRGQRHPPPRSQHGRLLADIGPFCQGDGRNFSFDPRILEVDHIRPKSDGGSDAYDNLTLLCPPCNKEKRDRLTLTELQRQNRRNGHLLAENEGNIRHGQGGRSGLRRR